jgi:hypothetical protein
MIEQRAVGCDFEIELLAGTSREIAAITDNVLNEVTTQKRFATKKDNANALAAVLSAGVFYRQTGRGFGNLSRHIGRTLACVAVPAPKVTAQGQMQCDMH